MVVKMMKWRPWPPLISRKYEVKLKVQRLEGFNWVCEGAEEEDVAGLSVEIRWKGPKHSLGSFRRTVKRNCTREVRVKRVDDDEGQNGGVLVEWDEDFREVCGFSGYKENVFHAWEIDFTVLRGLSQGVKSRISTVGLAALNLADYASKNEEQVIEVKVPLVVIPNVAVERRPLLCISISLLELRAAQESKEVVHSQIMPLSYISASRESASAEKDEVSSLKAGLKKVRIFTEYVSTRRPKKASHEEECSTSDGKCSGKSEDGENSYPFDSDSLDEIEEGESEENKEDSALRKSFSYGTLALANYAGVSSYSISGTNNEDEDWIYYSNRRRSDVGCSFVEDSDSLIPEQSLIQNPKRSILPWKKRKLSFRSSKAKGEPLLKKAYGEEGGDDIDFDRRQLSSDESLSSGEHKTDPSANGSLVSEFGDDNFAVGTWEQKEITSRDGQMKIQTQVFFASIDQRSERAAGGSACTVLVAVIADWLQNNLNLMPIKSQFDSLIRDGSLEWRNLCENETYREQFPDKHFDLETVLQAKTHDLCVVPEKSFIGFFHPDGMEEGDFDFLNCAMSFDNIWDEINRSGSASRNGEAPVFIVSWNDHFFVLKVETDAYYIIDTLGERLHEGCAQAYILKFDRDSAIYKLPSNTQSLDEKPVGEQHAVAAAVESQITSPLSINSSENPKEDSEERTSVTGSEEPLKREVEEEIICQGKESCKDYIKNFLAAIPIRELQADLKKGLTMSTPLYQRLQIEFHFTQLQQPASSLLQQKPEVDVTIPEVDV